MQVLRQAHLDSAIDDAWTLPCHAREFDIDEAVAVEQAAAFVDEPYKDSVAYRAEERRKRVGDD